MFAAARELARCLADAGMALRLLAARTGSATNLGQAAQPLRPPPAADRCGEPAATPAHGGAGCRAADPVAIQDGLSGDLIEAAANLLRSTAKHLLQGPARQAGLRAMLAAELAGVHELAHTRTGAPADLLAAARAYQDAIAADPPGRAPGPGSWGSAGCSPRSART